MDCGPLGSSPYGILQARILEWVTISFSRASTRPRHRICVSCIAGGFFTTEPPGKLIYWSPLVLRFLDIKYSIPPWVSLFREKEKSQCSRLNCYSDHPSLFCKRLWGQKIGGWPWREKSQGLHPVWPRDNRRSGNVMGSGEGGPRAKKKRK